MISCLGRVCLDFFGSSFSFQLHPHLRQNLKFSGSGQQNETFKKVARWPQNKRHLQVSSSQLWESAVQWFSMYLNTVDGRNPAPPEMCKTRWIMVDSPYQLVSWILPSTVHFNMFHISPTVIAGLLCTPVPSWQHLQPQTNNIMFSDTPLTKLHQNCLHRMQYRGNKSNPIIRNWPIGSSVSSGKSKKIPKNKNKKQPGLLLFFFLLPQNHQEKKNQTTKKTGIPGGRFSCRFPTFLVTSNPSGRCRAKPTFREIEIEKSYGQKSDDEHFFVDQTTMPKRRPQKSTEKNN